MAFIYGFIKLHVIIFNEVLNNKFPKTNPVVPSSLLAPESWCHCHWISTPLDLAYCHTCVMGFKEKKVKAFKADPAFVS